MYQHRGISQTCLIIMGTVLFIAVVLATGTAELLFCLMTLGLMVGVLKGWSK